MRNKYFCMGGRTSRNKKEGSGRDSGISVDGQLATLSPSQRTNNVLKLRMFYYPKIIPWGLAQNKYP